MPEVKISYLEEAELALSRGVEEYLERILQVKDTKVCSKIVSKVKLFLIEKVKQSNL